MSLSRARCLMYLLAGTDVWQQHESQSGSVSGWMADEYDCSTIDRYNLLRALPDIWRRSIYPCRWVKAVTFTHSTTGTYFDTSALSNVVPVNRQGNAGRNQLFGPGLATGDVSLFKTLSFTERVKTELRAEVFNVTNTPQSGARPKVLRTSRFDSRSPRRASPGRSVPYLTGASRRGADHACKEQRPLAER